MTIELLPAGITPIILRSWADEFDRRSREKSTALGHTLRHLANTLPAVERELEDVARCSTLENAPAIRPEVAAAALYLERRLQKRDCDHLGDPDQTIRAAYEAASIGASLHTKEWQKQLAWELTLPAGVTALRIEEVRRGA